MILEHTAPHSRLRTISSNRRRAPRVQMAIDPEPDDSGPSDDLFLHEIEALGKALALDATVRRRSHPPDPKTTISSTPRNPTSSSSSSSFWTWKPLRALSRIRRRRFDCRFSLHIRSIHGLPPPLADSTLSVHWHPASDPSLSSHTRPSRATAGSAVFDETLTSHCVVHCSRTGVYDPKPFVIYASTISASPIVLGKHRVDIARLLPLTLDEVDDGRISGEWDTSFPLSGMERGGFLDVSFGFCLLVRGGSDSGDSGSIRKGLNDLDPNLATMSRNSGRNSMKRIGSNRRPRQFHRSLSCLQLQDDDEVLHEDTSSCTLGEELGRETGEDEDGPDYVVIEKGIEVAVLDNTRESRTENVDFDGLNQEGELILLEADMKQDRQEELSCCDVYPMERSLSPGDSAIQEVGSTYFNLPIHELEGADSSQLKAERLKGVSSTGVGPGYMAGSMNRSLSLDDLTETVATEFLSRLGLEQSSSDSSTSSDIGLSSEKQPAIARDLIFSSNSGVRKESIWGDSSEGFDHSFSDHASEVREHEKVTQAMMHELIAQTLIDEETEAIMREWDLDVDLTESSLPESREGFGSPIEIPLEEPVESPPTDR